MQSIYELQIQISHSEFVCKLTSGCGDKHWRNLRWGFVYKVLMTLPIYTTVISQLEICSSSPLNTTLFVLHKIIIVLSLLVTIVTISNFILMFSSFQQMIAVQWWAQRSHLIRRWRQPITVWLLCNWLFSIVIWSANTVSCSAHFSTFTILPNGHTHTHNSHYYYRHHRRLICLCAKSLITPFSVSQMMRQHTTVDFWPVRHCSTLEWRKQVFQCAPPELWWKKKFSKQVTKLPNSRNHWSKH